MLYPSPRVLAIGFSINRCLPRSAQAIACSAWRSFGVMSSTPSTAGCSTADSKESAASQPNSCAKAARLAAARLKAVTSFSEGVRRITPASRHPHMPMPMSATPTGSAIGAPRAYQDLAFIRQLFLHPVRHQRTILIGNVVADVITLFVHHQPSVGRFASKTLRVAVREEAIKLTEDYQHRLFNVGENWAQIQQFSNLTGSVGVLCTRMVDEGLTGNRWQSFPCSTEVVRPTDGDDGFDTLFEGGSAGRVIAAHADAHRADALQVEVRATFQCIKQSCNGLLIISPDMRRITGLALTGSVKGQRRHAALEEDLLPVEEFLLCGVKARQQQHQRR